MLNKDLLYIINIFKHFRMFNINGGFKSKNTETIFFHITFFMRYELQSINREMKSYRKDRQIIISSGRMEGMSSGLYRPHILGL